MNPRSHRRDRGSAWLVVLLLCFASIVTGAVASAQTASGAEPITFHRDVAPILAAHCVRCHRRGEVGPFPLVEYDEVEARADQLLSVIDSGYMPPWPPAPGPRRFRGERRLSAEERDVVRRWVLEGAVAGDPPAARPAAEFPEGWLLGEPDLIVAIPEPYTLPADGVDVFRNFVLQVPLAEPRWVRAVQIRPGNKSIVHHAFALLDSTDLSRQHDEEDPEPGFGEFNEVAAVSPEGQFLAWTPGSSPPAPTPGMAWRLEPQTDLVLQLHLLPSGKPEAVESAIGLYFTDEPPALRPLLLRLGPRTIDIPAGQADYVIEDEFVLPVAADLLAIYPHAHYLGRRLEGAARFPDGRVEPLILIEDWDFNWQDLYQLEEPLALPAGTALTMRYVYDNSSSNIRNPSQPPRRVSYGPHSRDEMGDLWLQLLPHGDADHELLRAANAEKERRSSVVGFEAAVARDPGDATGRYTLAVAYMRAGRTDDAIVQFRAAVELRPEYACAHSNLASALGARGDFEKARQHFEEARRLDPKYAHPLSGLAMIAEAAGRDDEAAEWYQKAFELDPDDRTTARQFADLECRRATAALAAGKPGEARARLRNALRIRPTHVSAMRGLAFVSESEGEFANAIAQYERVLRQRRDVDSARALAWLRATCPDETLRDGRQALLWAQRAAETTGQPDARILDVTAAALAELGRFPQAIQTARKAIEAATRAGDADLTASIQTRLALYQVKRPCRRER